MRKSDWGRWPLPVVGLAQSCDTGFAMTSALTMLRSHPVPITVDRDTLLARIDACFECAQSCVACADACLGEADLQVLVRCIRLNLDCADICNTTGAVLSRQTETEWNVLKTMLMACAAACRACAEVCRRCEDACNRMLSAIPVQT